jgi:hypothetical protein
MTINAGGEQSIKGLMFQGAPNGSGFSVDHYVVSAKVQYQAGPEMTEDGWLDVDGGALFQTGLSEYTD